MRKQLFIWLFTIVFIVLISCKFDTDRSNSNVPATNNTPSNPESAITNISREYWGTWIQMDTGTEYYIDNLKVYESSTSNKKYREVSSGITGYTLESENILKKGNLVYFRKGGATRDFSIQIAGFTDSYSRAVGTGRQGINGRRKNQENPGDSQDGVSGENGTITFTDAVADDTQTVTVLDTSVSVKPKYNGENLGTVPIVESGMYGFKTTYTINSDSEGFCYGNYYKTYTLSLNINNIGTETCSTSVYEISCSDSNLQVISGNLTGNFSSIEPGKSKNIQLQIRYGNINQEYVDVPVSISITDSKYERTWNDSVTLRFYKGVVSLKVNSRNFDSNSSAKLNGFVIYPDGRSKRFTVSAGNTNTVLIPWSESDYYLAFSGATSSNEMGYSFGFSEKTALANLNGTWSISEINAYESNDIVNSAYGITDLTSPAKAYLKDGDIDFYTINCSTVEVGFIPVSYNAREISDATSFSSVNNGNSAINPGETIKMDVRVHNNSDSMISDLTAVLSTTSEYVTIAGASKSYGDITGGYYKSLYGTSYYANNYSWANGSNNQNYYSSEMSASYGWQFTVFESTPYNTEIPFILTFSDAYGSTWTDSFSVTVVERSVNIVYHANAISDAASFSSVNNGDSKINPGETIKMDIRVSNSDTSLAQSITAVLSTASEYVTIAGASKSYGDITGGYYKSLYGTSYYANNYSWANGSNNQNYYSSEMSASYGWQFTVFESTPYNTEIPFILTFSDAYGSTWTDSFSVTVVERNVNMVYHARAISDATSFSSVNNGDSTINPGETIKMDVRVRNSGSSLAQGITAVLSTTSGYVTIAGVSKSYGNITGGYYKTLYGAQSYTSGNYVNGNSDSNYGSSSLSASYGWQFTVSDSTPYDTEIPFTLTFTDAYGSTWTDSFSVTVQ